MSLVQDLRKQDDKLCDDAADEIEDLESQLSSAEHALERAEAELERLREKAARYDALGERLCSACSFGTTLPAMAFCSGCGARKP